MGSQNPFELELKTSPTSKNRPESNGNSRSRSPQSWFLPSSEVSAMSGDEPDSGFESTTPQAYSEDSQEALSRKLDQASTDEPGTSSAGFRIPDSSAAAPLRHE